LGLYSFLGPALSSDTWSLDTDIAAIVESNDDGCEMLIRIDGLEMMRVLGDVKALESKGRRRVLEKAARNGAFPILRLKTWRA